MLRNSLACFFTLFCIILAAPLPGLATGNASQCLNCIRIGILPLKYLGNRETISLYAEGMQNTLIHALSSQPSLQVLDRARTQDVLKEVAFQQSAYVDKKAQVKIGKMLGVQYLYTGSVQEAAGSLRILLWRVNVETGEVSNPVKVSGRVNDLFKLHDRAAAQVLKQMHLSPVKSDSSGKDASPEGTSSLQAYEYYIRGTQLYREGKFKDSVASFTRAIELDSEYVYAYNERGIAYAKLKRYTEALMDYEKTISLRPGYNRPYLNKGLLFRDLEQKEQALDFISRGLSLDPSYTKAYVIRGNVYRDMKRYVEALQDYQQAINRAPEYALSYYNRAILYYFLKDHKKAIADYSSALKITPSNPDLYLNRGLSYTELEQYSLAISDFTVALVLRPQDAQIYYARARARYLSNQDAQAIQDWKESCQLGFQSACDLIKEKGF